MDLYQKIFVDVWPWWIGGPLIGLFVLAYLFFLNRILSASSSFQAVLEAAEGKGDPESLAISNFDVCDLPVVPADPSPRWRVWFLLGLLIGGLLSGLPSGTWGRAIQLPGMASVFGSNGVLQAGILLISGILIGFGTRMSGGCTSGHAISGISARQWPSLLATLTFMAVGMGLTFALKFMGFGQ